MLKAIVFDFDGTLLESAEIKTDAFAELFRDHPQHQREILEYHLAHAGISRYLKFRAIYRDILKRPLVQEEEERLGLTFQRLIAEQIAVCPYVPGARAFLQTVAGQYKCFIASGTPDAELQPLVAQRGLEEFFDEVHGAPAAKAEILKSILRRHALAPSEVLSIGDALSDLEAARAEQIPFAGRVRLGEAVIFPHGSTVALFHDFEELAEEWSALLARVTVS
jgi:phosphoglycolate phosphatase-like HAD superfamily hydrolase